MASGFTYLVRREYTQCKTLIYQKRAYKLNEWLCVTIFSNFTYLTILSNGTAKQVHIPPPINGEWSNCLNAKSAGTGVRDSGSTIRNRTKPVAITPVFIPKSAIARSNLQITTWKYRPQFLERAGKWMKTNWMKERNVNIWTNTWMWMDGWRNE